MFLNKNIVNLDQSISKVYKDKFQSIFQGRRNQIFRGPKQHTEDYHLEFVVKGAKRWKLNELRLFSVLSWYVEPEMRYHFNLFLEEVWNQTIKHCVGEQILSLEIERELMLSSKVNCLGYLILQEEFNESDFFGNILTLNTVKQFYTFRILSVIVPDIKNSDKQYSGWCRGPKDKGSTPTKENPNKFIEDTREISREITNELLFEDKLKLLLYEIESLPC